MAGMFRHSLLLLFRPSSFIELATRESIDRELSSRRGRSGSSDAELSLERVDGLRKTARNHTQKIRKALLGGLRVTFATVFVAILLGVGLACWIEPSPLFIYVSQAIGAAVILGATLGETGRDIQTWDGHTLPERVNAWTFQRLYIIGTLAFVASFSWDAAYKLIYRN